MKNGVATTLGVLAVFTIYLLGAWFPTVFPVLLADVWTVGATVVCILLVRAIYFECCGAHRDSDAKAASTPGGRRGSWVSPESGAEDTGPRRGDGLEDFPVMQSSRADAYSQSRPLRRLGTRASVDLDGAQSYVQPQQGRLLDRADTSIAVRTPEDYYAASAGRGDPGRLSPYGGSPSSPKTFGLCAYCHGSIRDEDPVWIDNQAVHAGCAACARCQQRFNGTRVPRRYKGHVYCLDCMEAMHDAGSPAGNSFRMSPSRSRIYRSSASPEPRGASGGAIGGGGQYVTAQDLEDDVSTGGHDADDDDLGMPPPRRNLNDTGLFGA